MFFSSPNSLEPVSFSLIFFPVLPTQFSFPDHGGREVKKLFLFLLNYAVQSRRKEIIIERIQNMEEDRQKGIVECIKEVSGINECRT